MLGNVSTYLMVCAPTAHLIYQVLFTNLDSSTLNASMRYWIADLLKKLCELVTLLPSIQCLELVLSLLRKVNFPVRG